MHNNLVLRADEFVETLQWNLCRATVASVTAVLEHDVSVATFFRSLSVPIHDPEKKLHLQPIHGIYQCAALSFACFHREFNYWD
jgi:hypothetical protein